MIRNDFISARLYQTKLYEYHKSVLPIIRIDHINTKEYIFGTRCVHLSQ